ncbi:MAG TPA: hypothetical protein VJH91_03045 [Candidatus Paceibacterota bacterium]
MPDNREICIAPKGHLRLIHVDARDHWHSLQGDFKSPQELTSSLSAKLHSERLELRAFNDCGEEIAI